MSLITHKKRIFLLSYKSDGLDILLVNNSFDVKKSNCPEVLLEEIHKIHEYDLLIINLLKPKYFLYELLQKVRKSAFSSRLPVIVIDSEISPNNHIHSLKYGADDYIQMPYEPETLIARIESLIRRAKWCAELANNLTDKAELINYVLTRRQLEILKLIAKGYSNKQVASKLFVSEKTIKAHVHALYKKLNVKNRTQAILAGVTQGLIDIE
jgi:DNA-binding NarL/FixJ family response regulator